LKEIPRSVVLALAETSLVHQIGCVGNRRYDFHGDAVDLARHLSLNFIKVLGLVHVDTDSYP